MSRALKFRVWDREQKKMYQSDGSLFVLNDNCNYPEIYQNLKVEDSGYWSDEGVIDDEPIIQQFTGLLDKNGAEIYEGDIVLDPTANGETYKTVSQQEGGEYIISGNQWFDQLLSRAKYCEIVGNIFE